ncbi:DNA/RNA non-specific endonuclease [uncultured Muribaculum sp.]|uniref:DNA/RNA non-specific endonuclease n=2 Tax=uncultured Muribaculum sp. TaxID=1918613 RepID=UPI0025B7989A|nr:DNA/RNA non-specific endonuclease [uncultured Muribaculum sp.]
MGNIKRRHTAASRKKAVQRPSLHAKGYLGALILLLAFIAIMSAKSRWESDKTATTEQTSQIKGLEKVITNPDLDEIIVDYAGMKISFNPTMHIPNWVAWELTAAEANGTEERKDKFTADNRVAGCPSPSDYSNSGYDRGHMAPAGDMKWSQLAMKESFYMTNICPQHKKLNAGSWKRLEEKCRDWAIADSAIIIIAGPVLSEKITESIGENKVCVPKRFFKVILSPYTNPPRAIGFVMPNGPVPGGMQATAMSVDDVEHITGHDFFSTLPQQTEQTVESQCQFHKWASIK